MSPRKRPDRVRPILARYLDITGFPGDGGLAIAPTSTPLPVEVRHGIRIQRGEQIVGVLRNRNLADFMIEGPRGLRALVAVMNVLWTMHGETSGTCLGCQQAAPCETRRQIEAMLVTSR